MIDSSRVLEVIGSPIVKEHSCLLILNFLGDWVGLKFGRFLSESLTFTIHDLPSFIRRTKIFGRTFSLIFWTGVIFLSLHNFLSNPNVRDRLISKKTITALSITIVNIITCSTFVYSAKLLLMKTKKQIVMKNKSFVVSTTLSSFLSNGITKTV